VIISAGNSQMFGAGARYFNVFSANRSFAISSKNQGLDKTTVKSGYSYDLEKFSEITIHNDGIDDLNIEFELSNLKVVTGSNSGVEVTNVPSIQKIVEPIQVNATSTVENGKMAKLVSNNFAPIATAKATILDGATVEVFPARIGLNRVAVIQLITNSTNMSKISIADSAVNASPTSGIFVQGNLDAPGGYELETETAIYVHNFSGETITLAGGETWRV